ncbi:unnamed protein product, partial [Rotaria sp. Silwood1]
TVTSCAKMSEHPATTTTTSLSTKEDEVNNNTTLSNSLKGKKFEGDGLRFKGKLIGTEDLSVDRDEKLCLDSMLKLKAAVRTRGEHKQRIQLKLTMIAVKIIDDATKKEIVNHELDRISFVVIDPRDLHAFGYIYNTSDDRHQFWAIKTERPAAMTVIKLKELFDLIFEQFTNAETAKEVGQTVVTRTHPLPPSLSQPKESSLARTTAKEN